MLDTNDDPSFTDVTIWLDEDANVGDEVADLSAYASDEDSGDYTSSLNFTLVTESETFYLTAAGLLKVKSTSLLDYERGPQHFSLSIEVNDFYGGSTTGSVFVNITNINEDPYIVRNQTFYVDEDASKRKFYNLN